MGLDYACCNRHRTCLISAFNGRIRHQPDARGTWITSAAVILYGFVLGWQILLARFGHFYELTDRRLFIDTGVFRRRRDQIELLRVQDVYVK